MNQIKFSHSSIINNIKLKEKLKSYNELYKNLNDKNFTKFIINEYFDNIENIKYKNLEYLQQLNFEVHNLNGFTQIYELLNINLIPVIKCWSDKQEKLDLQILNKIKNKVNNKEIVLHSSDEKHFQYLNEIVKYVRNYYYL